jgi:hypothetical protein
MTKKPEASFYQKMKKGMTGSKITRVESWVNLGIPDCIVALNDAFHLVELKVADAKGKVKVSPHQVAFHSRHKGCPVWLFVQYDKGRKSKLLIYPAWQSYEVAKMGIFVPPVLEQSYPWDWEGVETFLKKALDKV